MVTRPIKEITPQPEGQGVISSLLTTWPQSTNKGGARCKAWPSPVRGASLPRSIRQRGDSRPGRAYDHDLVEHPGTGAADNSCCAAATLTYSDGDEKLTSCASRKGNSVSTCSGSENRLVNSHA